MINFCDQFLITFTLGDQKDFIKAEDLYSFNLYYVAGNIRPSFDLSFKLQNERVIPFLNSGNILILSFGTAGELKQDVLQFQLTGDNADIQYNVGSDVSIKGVLYKPNFTDYIGYDFYENKTSIEVISQIANKNNFRVISNVGKTADCQNWYRESDTYWNFMQYVWLHSYLNDDTFFSYGMDCDNIYFYDMRKLAQSGAKWLVTNKYNSSEKSNVICVPSYKPINNYGEVANLIGKNLKISVYDVDNGQLLLQDYKLKSFGTIDTNKINVLF